MERLGWRETECLAPSPVSSILMVRPLVIQPPGLDLEIRSPPSGPSCRSTGPSLSNRADSRSLFLHCALCRYGPFLHRHRQLSFPQDGRVDVARPERPRLMGCPDV